jgi:hypothetical protein
MSIDCKNFCKCQNVPPPSPTIKRKKQRFKKKKKVTGHMWPKGQVFQPLIQTKKRALYITPVWSKYSFYICYQNLLLNDMLIDNMVKLDQQSQYFNFEVLGVCQKCYIECQNLLYAAFFKLSIKSHHSYSSLFLLGC